MDKKNVFMFSGQGSQYYRMGKELYENHKIFKYWMDTCNEIVAPLIQTSLTEIIYDKDKKGEAFDRVLYTNPSLLSIQYSMFHVLKDMGIHPDFLMGYSLGEITASMVSEVMTLEDGLSLSVDMARLVEEKTPQATMLAIMAEKQIIADDPGFFTDCWLIATNFSGSFVMCGLPDDIKLLQNMLREKGITTQLLPVNYGFHTPLIDDLENQFKQRVKEINLSVAKIPIISSKESGVINELTYDYFWEIIRYPVNFERTVKNTIKNKDYVFIDLGPSGSLATSVKYILDSNSGSVPLQILNQYGKNLDALEKFATNFTVNQ
jgi:bacillaene synthase trans-acting acyltransferase